MERNHLPKLIIILGPTATGKSDLAVILAKKLNGEVISADSRQVYTGLNIGTGKITKKEMKGVQHHLLDIADPKKQFSAEKYRVLAQEAIQNILRRGKLPILCGGSGFYIDAAVNDVVFPNVPANKKIRAKLADSSAAQLLKMLKKLDPKRAKAMEANNSEKNNARRLIRAIEVVSAMSEVGPPRLEEVPPRYSPLFIGLNVSPAELRRRIYVRLLKRMKAGMVKEAKRLHSQGLSWKRMHELGLEYRYLALFLQGKMTREEMLAKLETEIWRYSRRQMTWFKRNKKIKWSRPIDRTDIVKKIKSALKK